MRSLELVAIIIALLGVVNAVLASVIDRTREIGVLRAIGMLRRQTYGMVVIEAGALGVASAVMGTMAGLVLGYILVEYIHIAHSGWHVPYLPAWAKITELSLAVTAVSAAAGWYPARAAAHIELVDALEYE
jgi:putative ABC transport system permease protein